MPIFNERAESAGSVGDGSITNAKLANVPTQTIKGRVTAGTGTPQDLTATQATTILNPFVGDSGSGGTKGLVPAPAAGDAAAGKFLKADGSFAVPSGGGSGATTELDNLTTTAINADLNFDADMTYQIGSTTNRVLRVHALIVGSDGTDFDIITDASGGGVGAHVNMANNGRIVLDDNLGHSLIISPPAETNRIALQAGTGNIFATADTGGVFLTSGDDSSFDCAGFLTISGGDGIEITGNGDGVLIDDADGSEISLDGAGAIHTSSSTFRTDATTITLQDSSTGHVILDAAEGGSITAVSEAVAISSVGSNLALTSATGQITLTSATGGIKLDGPLFLANNIAANDTTASVLTPLSGPVGAQTSIQGWVQISVGGTPRFIPFW